MGLGTADTIVHHVHAFTIHVTALILLLAGAVAYGLAVADDLFHQARCALVGRVTGRCTIHLDPLGCHNSAGSLFVWAFSLMFLFSGRGYWQELIESIIWAHKVVVAAHVLVYAGHCSGSRKGGGYPGDGLGSHCSPYLLSSSLSEDHHLVLIHSSAAHSVVLQYIGGFFTSSSGRSSRQEAGVLRTGSLGFRFGV